MADFLARDSRICVPNTFLTDGNTQWSFFFPVKLYFEMRKRAVHNLKPSGTEYTHESISASGCHRQPMRYLTIFSVSRLKPSDGNCLRPGEKTCILVRPSFSPPGVDSVVVVVTAVVGIFSEKCEGNPFIYFFSLFLLSRFSIAPSRFLSELSAPSNIVTREKEKKKTCSR